MNDRIRTIAVVGMILLAALVAGTTYWQAWAGGELASKKDNAIQLVAQFKIDRGVIRAPDGTVLAANRVLHQAGNTFYLRRYPTGKVAADVVGYSTQGRSRAAHPAGSRVRVSSRSRSAWRTPGSSAPRAVFRCCRTPS